MKMKFIKPLAIAAIFGLSMFSCAGTDDAQTDTDVQDTETTAVLETEPEVMEEPEVATTETERLSNEDVSYADMFEGVETEQYDVLSLVRMDPNLSTFVELLEMSGLEASLQVEMVEPVTLLVPTNQAFMDMDRGEYQRLTDPNNKTELVEFVKHHILPSKVYETQFNTTQVIDTDGENDIPIDSRMNGEVIYVGGAQIMKSDIDASNGLIHIVNGVVQPSEFDGPGY